MTTPKSPANSTLKPLILAIDQGTTSSRALVFDTDLQQVAVAQQEYPQIYPRSGWVEHDPEAIWSSTLAVVREVLARSEAEGQVVALGITNQRETVVLWDRETGKPIGNAIVWQDRRTAAHCQHLKRAGHEQWVRKRTGLLLDPYFSATKIAWLLEHVDGARRRAKANKLAVGTVDSFLLWRLTEGAAHRTDATNASRTLLYDIEKGRWDDELLALFDIPRALLPEVADCAAPFGITNADIVGRELPILGMAGDQQAATIGQACFAPGDTKSTYGTGAFVVTNTGDERVHSEHRLLSTVAYRLDGKVTFALEGSIFVAGAAVQWLRDRLRFVEKAPQSEELARKSAPDDGVYLVPAFTGLGAPHWDPDARGALLGMTLSTGMEDIVRATLESVCFQTHDLFEAMAQDGFRPSQLRVDGGMVGNDWMLQCLADVLDLTIEKPDNLETTALGAAYLAGRQAGLLGDLEDFAASRRVASRFVPALDAGSRARRLQGWREAVARVKAV